MKFGIHYSLGVGMNPSMDDYVRVAVKAEELGYHSAWLGDHVVIPEKIESTYPYTPDGSASFPRRLPFPDTFVVLAALGAHTQTIKLGTSVIVVPYRNPLPVAKAVATVDMATSGRYLFGVGVGWLAEEFEALGEKFSERGSRTREYLQVMKAVWQEEAASFEGKYFSFPDLYALPLPVQKPHPPIIFGGEEYAGPQARSRPGRRLAARSGPARNLERTYGTTERAYGRTRPRFFAVVNLHAGRCKSSSGKS